MSELTGSKMAILSKTNWGALFMFIAPIIAARTGLTSENLLDIGNLAITAGGAIFTIYSRIRASKKISG